MTNPLIINDISSTSLLKIIKQYVSIKGEQSINNTINLSNLLAEIL